METPERKSEPAVETRVEESRRVVTARQGETAWEFSVWQDWPDGEPRIRDTDAAERLGFARARKIRDLIERTWPDDRRPNSRPTVGRQSTGNGASREYEVTEYWLTEAELLKLCARARTEVAEAVLDDMIATYLAVRRHLLLAAQPKVPTPAPLPVNPALAELGTRLGCKVVVVPGALPAPSAVTPEGHVLVRATATSTAAELEAEARRALALLKARVPAVKTFGELDDWSQLRRMARTNRGAEPEALDLVARWPVPPDVVVSAAFVAALAGAAYDYSVRAAFLHAKATPEVEVPATTGRAVGTFRELPEWQELRLWASQIDRRPLTLKQIDRIADWPVPPGVQVSPVFVLDTAWLCLGYYVPQEPPARGETKGR